MSEQKQKFNPRQLLNIGLLLLVGALTLLVIFEPGTEPPVTKPKITPLTINEVEQILIKRQGKPAIELQKRDKVWYLNKPFTVAANDFRAQTIARIATANSHAHYEINKVDPKKFNLDKPEATLIINGQYHIALGNKEALKRRRYLQVNQQLHVIDDTFYYQLMSPATTYVSYNLLPPNSQITSIKLPKLKLTNIESKWQVKPEPKDYSADSATLLITEWQHAQALEVEQYTGAKGKKLKSDIVIQTAGQTQPIKFAISRTQGDIYLINHHSKLQYKLTRESLDKLLNLPPAAEAEPDTAADAGSKQTTE